MSFCIHYDDVIMTMLASQITSLMVVYSIVYLSVNQRKHQSSASLAFVWGIHRDRWILRTKGQLRGKCFHLVTSSWFFSVPFSWSKHIQLIHTQWNSSGEYWSHKLGPPLKYKDDLSRYKISIIKIRRSWDRFIFIMGISILVGRYLLYWDALLLQIILW